MRAEAKSERFWRLVDREAEPEQVVTGFAFTEGPVYSRRGYLLFSDIPTNRILKWEGGKLSVFREPSNGANGLTFDHQGRLLTCERGRVTRTEKNGAVTVLAEEGLEGPNDLVYAIDGSVYFTDLRRGRVHQITRERAGVGGAPPRGAVRVVADGGRPNGVALGPTQRELYVADSGTGGVKVYGISGDGGLRDGRGFCDARGDGLKTDEEGNVWVAAADGVRVYSREGEHLGTIRVPEAPSNCAWGAGFRGLYITARTSVYYMAARVAGTRTY